MPLPNSDPHTSTAERDRTRLNRRALVGRLGGVAAAAVLSGALAAGISALGHSGEGKTVAAPTVSRPVAWPKGTPNFDPTVSGSQEADLDLELDASQNVTGLLQGPQYVGYARSTSTPGTYKLLGGAKLTPTAHGGVEVDPLHGPKKELDISPTRLQTGPVSIAIGAGHDLQVGVDPTSGLTDYYFGPANQPPDPGTFQGQPEG